MDPISLGLPHREPFVFLDAVVQVQSGSSATATKTFLPDDPVFLGHFPGDPIVPGVLLTEALAQTAGLAVGGDGQRYLLSAIRAMKFPRAARPGDAIILQAEKTGEIEGLINFDVTATVDGTPVAEGRLVLAKVIQTQINM